jgi:hypothetical protein
VGRCWWDERSSGAAQGVSSNEGSYAYICMRQSFACRSARDARDAKAARIAHLLSQMRNDDGVKRLRGLRWWWRHHRLIALHCSPRTCSSWRWHSRRVVRPWTATISEQKRWSQRTPRARRRSAGVSGKAWFDAQGTGGARGLQDQRARCRTLVTDDGGSAGVVERFGDI